MAFPGRSRDDRARSYHCISSDSNSGNDGCICPYRGAFPNQGGDQVPGSVFNLCPWSSIVGNNRVGSDKNAILDRNQVPHSNAVLDGHAVADLYLRLDKGMIADITLASNNRAMHHVGESPNAGAPADRVRLNKRMRVDKTSV